MLTGHDRSFELRLKRTWHGLAPGLNDAIPEQQPMWVICSIFPELTDDGEVLEIIGCFTDIRYVFSTSWLRRSYRNTVNKSGEKSYRLRTL
jgi:hypothetical protein